MSNAVAKPGERPAHLAKYATEGADLLAQYQQLQRLKVVQDQTDRELKKLFPAGSAILAPERSLVAHATNPFEAAVLFFWPSWERWADLDDKSHPPGPVESSLDPASEVARAARNPKTRLVPYPDNTEQRKWNWRNIESLNFAIRIETGPAAGAVAVVSFNKGSHGLGSGLCGYLKRRADTQGVSIWANRLVFATHEVPGKTKGTFWVPEWKPAEEPFCSAADADVLKATYDGLKKAHDGRTIGVASDVPADEDGAGIDEPGSEG